MDHDHARASVNTPDQPAPTKLRYSSIDTLRGFALLGILVPNIWFFAWPMQSYKDSTILSDTAMNKLAHSIMWIGFDSKFRFLFAMLFGAGVVIYSQKFDNSAKRNSIATGASLWYIRCSILLVFGLMHAYLFWYGDILTMYAVAGLTLLWWIRRIPIPIQLPLGIVLYFTGILIMIGLSYLQVRSEENGGQTEFQFMSAAAQIEAYTGSWSDAFKSRFFTTLIIQLLFMPLYMPTLWGIMTLGIVLVRTKVLTGDKSLRWYIIAASIGFAVGIPLTWAWFNWQQGAQSQAQVAFRHVFVEPAGVALAFGYAMTIIALSKINLFKLITIPLAAVGRMALTNYFAHTLLCTTFFYGYGLGYFAQIEYPQLWLVVLSVWAFNIIFSLLWLRVFKMGPFEWLWRCLTYRQLVPIR